MSAATGWSPRGLVAVAVGGALGTVARVVLVAEASHIAALPAIVPLVVINAGGGVLAGAFLARRRAPAGERPSPWQDLLVPGFCGGFTTFSGLAGQAHEFLRNGDTATAILALAIGLHIGLFAGRVGRSLAGGGAPTPPGP